MFGLMRYGFALAVMIHHIYVDVVLGPAGYATWGFYCLSGYLISLVLNEKYGFDLAGLRAFAVSRALRLLPAYYATCLLMVAVLAASPKNPFAGAALEVPKGALTWLNILVPLVWSRAGNDLIPQFYAVRIEILHYALMALGLARWKAVAWAWFGCCVAYSAYLQATDASLVDRYMTPWSTSIAFAAGVLLSRYRRDLPSWSSPWALAAAAAVLIGHVAAIRLIAPESTFTWGLFTGLAASALAILLARDVDPRRVPAWLRAADQALGDLSYPIYLSHWVVAIVVSACLGGRGPYSRMQAVATFVAVHAVSWAIFRFVETPGDRLRKRLVARGLGGAARGGEGAPPEAAPIDPSIARRPLAGG